MAKRQPRRPTRTSDPDAAIINEPTIGASGEEVLGATPRQTAAEVDDRAPRPADAEGPAGDVSYDDIAALAYDLWARRGHGHGNDFDDWLEAERQLRETRRRR